jgi:hypothetical protein
LIKIDKKGWGKQRDPSAPILQRFWDGVDMKKSPID